MTRSCPRVGPFEVFLKIQNLQLLLYRQFLSWLEVSSNVFSAGSLQSDPII